MDFSVGTGSEQAKEKLVERVAFPPSINIGFTQAEITLQYCSRVYLRVLYPDIPRPAAPDLYFRILENGLEFSSEQVVLHRICFFILVSAP
jgi:hypothetical protein